MSTFMGRIVYVCLNGYINEPHGSQANDVHVLLNDLEVAAKVLDKAEGYPRTNLKGINQHSICYCSNND